MWKIVVGVLSPTLLIATVAVSKPMVDSVRLRTGAAALPGPLRAVSPGRRHRKSADIPGPERQRSAREPWLDRQHNPAGTGTMPPFPDLTAAEISAVATYIRNAWANGFGGMTTSDATAVLEGIEADGYLASVWDGVFTEVQAERGRAAYPGACGLCHGRRLNGAPDDPDMRSTPPLTRARFLRNWDGRSLATLFEYTRATMPEDNPGSLTDEEYVDVIAYMLSVGGMPAGEAELRPDMGRLARVVIEQQP